MPKSKKLIYILNSYSAVDSSHFQHVLGLLEEMAKLGIEIALIIEKADRAPVFQQSSISVTVLKSRQKLQRFFELFLVLFCLIRRGYRRTFVRIAAPAALTATLAHRMFGGVVYLWQSGTTLEFDCNQPFSLHKLQWEFSSHLPNLLARRWVDYFVTGPSYMVDYYIKVARVDPKKIRLLYNDIDIERFKRPDNSAELKISFLGARGLSEDTLILLIVHRLSPVRRTLLYFPECIAHLDPAKVRRPILTVVAGGGAELPSIKCRAKQLGVDDQCLFLGSVPNLEIEKLYAIADVFLHPTYNEGFPRVILEAMAAGLPIATTDAGGTIELLGEDQKNCVVSKDKPAEFSEVVQRLAMDASFRQRLSSENREHVKRYATDKVAIMYQDVLFP